MEKDNFSFDYLRHLSAIPTSDDIQEHSPAAIESDKLSRVRGKSAVLVKERCAMKNVKVLASRFMQDESGQNLVEYALVVVLIALAAITAMGSLGNGVSAAFAKIGTSLNSAI